MAPRPEKVAVVDEVKTSLDGAVATILTDYRGLSVGELAELRAELRKANATYKVAKNTLMRRAAAEAKVEIDQLLVGPTALVFCQEDPVAPAKALKAFAKAHPELVVKGSWLDGEVLDAEETMKLADLESREELLAKMVGLMYGALANTARLLNAAPTKMAQLVAALIADGGVEAKGFTPTAAAPAAEAPAAEEAAAEDATEDSGVVEAATDAVEAVVETATDAAEAVVETAAEAAGDAAEAVADVAEAAAEAIAPEDAEASDGEASETDEQTEQA